MPNMVNFSRWKINGPEDIPPFRRETLALHAQADRAEYGLEHHFGEPLVSREEFIRQALGWARNGERFTIWSQVDRLVFLPAGLGREKRREAEASGPPGYPWQKRVARFECWTTPDDEVDGEVDGEADGQQKQTRAERLRRVQRRIEELTDGQFDMSSYGRFAPDGQRCGGLAYWTLAELEPETLKALDIDSDIDDHLEVKEAAGRALGLTDDDISRLFVLVPGEAAGRPGAGSWVRPWDASRVLGVLAETGRITWEYPEPWWVIPPVPLTDNDWPF